MKHTPFLLLVALFAAACNEKQAAPAVTAESEPNDSFAAADLLGSLASSSSIEIDGNVEHDDGQNDDLVDHFLVLPTYSGQLAVTLTPVEPLADVSFTEELTASTDGQLVDAAGAGLAESAQITVVSGLGLHLRVETAAAATDYTLNFSSPAPLSAELPEELPQLHIWRIDRATGELHHHATTEPWLTTTEPANQR